MSHKLKLAYISPLPPEKTGIAFYSKELVNFLAEYYEIYLVTEQKKIDSSLKQKYTILDKKEFVKNFHFFDRILYNIGNSFYHGYMIPLLEEIPGVVILHDIFLGDLINWINNSGIFPGIMSEEAYYSHGWSGLLEKKKDLEKFILNFPLNARILNNAIGVIIHNKYSLDILKKYFSILELDRFAIVPHLKKIEETSHKLDLKEPIIISLGFINHIKAPELIIEGFAKSLLKNNPNSKLIFVGEPINNYKEKLYKLAEKLGIINKVKITNFVSEELYKSYIQKAFIAIQLRKNSRGETSGTLLDLLSFGVPVIVNRHGSFIEFPENTVYFVYENPTAEDIADAINNLYLNSELRKKLSTNSIEYIKNYHCPKKVAYRIYTAIEDFYKKNSLLSLIKQTVNKIKNNKITLLHKKTLAKELAQKYLPTARSKIIYIDISAISLKDLKTGIQRVVKAQLKGLLNNPPSGFRVEPVRIAPESGWSLKYARNYTKEFLKLEKEPIPGDTNVIIRGPGIYFCPDLYYDAVLYANKKGIFQELKKHNIKIAFVIYDMLPIEFPNYFPDGTPDLHQDWSKVVLNISDFIICISEAPAESVIDFMKKNKIYNKNLKIEVLHLGSDITSVKHKEGLTKEDLILFKKISARPYFLMVSTLEPRKGHWQVIKAFEILWQKGLDFNLVIVGKKGWKVEELIKYIKSHPEFNNRLFWLGYVSDDLLELLYKKALATIIASENEGFGLSVIESAYYKTPIIARDIKVFREIANDGAFYFRNSKSAKVLAEDIEKWLSLYKEKRYPKPSNVKWLSWQEHIEKLKEILSKNVN